MTAPPAPDTPYPTPITHHPSLDTQDELPTTRIGGTDFNAMAQPQELEQLDGVDLDGIAPFVPPSEERGTNSYPMKPASPDPSGNVPIRPRPNKNGSSPGQGDPIQKLKQLRSMLEAGLITHEDFEQKKAEILSRI
jgi:hypothetical protein